MKCHIVILAIFVGCVSFSHAQSLNINDECTDSGVWIHGLIHCRYLRVVSGFGIHKDPGKFCRRNWDNCCRTCTELYQEGIIYYPGPVTTTRRPTTTQRTLAEMTEQYYTWFRNFMARHLSENNNQ